MKINKVNIYELHAALVLFRDKDFTYVDIEFNEELNKMTLTPTKIDTEEKPTKLEDIL